MLVLLENKPLYGYELLKVLRDRFEGVWTPQTGTVYPALKRLEELLAKTAEAGLEERSHLVQASVGEDETGEALQVLDLSNSSVRDLNNHVVYARDRERSHRQAAALLKFAAAHLCREVYAFDITDNFLAYLVDTEHPTAMPSGRFYERGVQ